MSPAAAAPPSALAPRPPRRRATTKRKRRAGRPTRLTRPVRLAIVAAIADGVSKDDAARAAGIDPATLYRGQANNASFAREIAKAEDALIPRIYSALATAAFGENPDWRAALALGKLKRPSEFNPPTRVALGGDPTNPTPIALDPGAEAREIAKKLAGMTTEELRAFAPVRKPVENV